MNCVTDIGEDFPISYFRYDSDLHCVCIGFKHKHSDWFITIRIAAEAFARTKNPWGDDTLRKMLEHELREAGRLADEYKKGHALAAVKP